MLDDMNCRENAVFQLASCCGDCCNRDAIIYYIETLEEIIRHQESGEPQFTINQKEVFAEITSKPRSV